MERKIWSYKRKGRIGIYSDIKRFFVIISLVEILIFQQNFRKFVGIKFLLGNLIIIDDFIYKVMYYSVVIQNYRFFREKKKGMYMDVYFIVVYSNKKMENNLIIQ